MTHRLQNKTTAENRYATDEKHAQQTSPRVRRPTGSLRTSWLSCRVPIRHRGVQARGVWWRVSGSAGPGLSGLFCHGLPVKRAISGFFRKSPPGVSQCGPCLWSSCSDNTTHSTAL